MWGRSRRDEQKPYRLGYPGQYDDRAETTMLRFYRNEISSKPSGDTIDNIHEKWFGDYAHLEIHHGYIQWIFPIREEGVNFSAPRLYRSEMLTMREDPAVRARIIRSYEMMLDFYGMVLLNRETGEVGRNEDTYKRRYNHLNNSFHNYLRISRILKALGEFGFERFKIHWINLFIEEAYEHKLLKNIRSSLQGYWIPTLRRREERVAAKNKIHEFQKEANTDDEEEDKVDNEEMKDLPTPPMPAAGESARGVAAGSEDEEESSEQTADSEDSSVESSPSPRSNSNDSELSNDKKEEKSKSNDLSESEDADQKAEDGSILAAPNQSKSPNIAISKPPSDSKTQKKRKEGDKKDDENTSLTTPESSSPVISPSASPLPPPVIVQDEPRIASISAATSSSSVLKKSTEDRSTSPKPMALPFHNVVLASSNDNIGDKKLTAEEAKTMEQLSNLQIENTLAGSGSDDESGLTESENECPTERASEREKSQSEVLVPSAKKKESSTSKPSPVSAPVEVASTESIKKESESS